MILVPSTSHAMRAEKVLGDASLACKLVPVPRQLSSDCGICVRIMRDDAKEAQRRLEAAGVVVEGIHDIES